MKTAVEWLFTQYVNKGIITIEDIEQANKMFEEQIIDAYTKGLQMKFVLDFRTEEYYNKTFKTN